MRVILIGISRDIEYDLRNDLFRHLVGLSSDFYGRAAPAISWRAHQRPERRSHDAWSGHHVLDRDQPDVRAGDRVMVSADWRLAFLPSCPRRLSALP